MMDTPLGRLRLVALVEGAAFLALLFVAMPLKYVFDMPLAVRVVGITHGVLFMALCWLLMASELPLKTRAQLFVAALLPFGPFLYDKHLRAAT